MDGPSISVDLAHVDWNDLTFYIRSFLPPLQLEDSLDRYGLLYPPWVWLRYDGKHTIVDGFKRLTWVRRRNWNSLNCVVLPPASEPREVMLRRVETKILGPPLNIVEKAEIIRKLLAIVPGNLIVERYLPALGVSGRVEALDRWRALAEAGDDLLDAAASEQISERSALELASWKDDGRTDALNLLKELRCSASIQKEILERIGEIAKAQERRRVEVLHHPDVQSLLQLAQWNHRQKTQALRDVLRRWRFPRLSRRENQFQRDLASVSLPKAIRLMHPPDFEGENWQLIVSFSDSAELRTYLQRALDFANSSSLKFLMSPGRRCDEKEPQP